MKLTSQVRRVVARNYVVFVGGFEEKVVAPTSSHCSLRLCSIPRPPWPLFGRLPGLASEQRPRLSESRSVCIPCAVTVATHFCIACSLLRVLFFGRHDCGVGRVSSDIHDDEDTDVLLKAKWMSHASEKLWPTMLLIEKCSES